LYHYQLILAQKSGYPTLKKINDICTVSHKLQKDCTSMLFKANGFNQSFMCTDEGQSGSLPQDYLSFPWQNRREGESIIYRGCPA
jgi:hypothetical protein